MTDRNQFDVSGAMYYGTPGGMVAADLSGDRRELLHQALDEWLNRSSGTGYFYVGNLADLTNDLQER